MITSIVENDYVFVILCILTQLILHEKELII